MHLHIPKICQLLIPKVQSLTKQKTIAAALNSLLTALLVKKAIKPNTMESTKFRTIVENIIHIIHIIHIFFMCVRNSETTTDVVVGLIVCWTLSRDKVSSSQWLLWNSIR